MSVVSRPSWLTPDRQVGTLGRIVAAGAGTSCWCIHHDRCGPEVSLHQDGVGNGGELLGAVLVSSYWDQERSRNFNDRSTPQCGSSPKNTGVRGGVCHARTMSRGNLWGEARNVSDGSEMTYVDGRGVGFAVGTIWVNHPAVPR